MKTHMKQLIGLALVTTITEANMYGDSDVLHPDYIQRMAYIDCEQMGKALASGLQKLRKDGRLVGMDVLREQLSRKQCEISLPPVAGTKLTPIELYAQKKDSVVVIGSLGKCGKCSKWHTEGEASGFLITKEGVLVTNYHVINREESELLAAMTSDGIVYPILEVLAADEASDVAIVKLEGSEFPFLRLQPRHRIGDRTWAISNPKGFFYLFTEGIISGCYFEGSKGKSSKRFSVNTQFSGGSSGAPVFDACGNVVGMIRGAKMAAHRSKSASTYFHPGFPHMVINECIPSESIIRLFKTEEAGYTDRVNGGGQ